MILNNVDGISNVELSTLDVSFFIIALGISVAIGIYFANKNKSLNDYMLGGKDQRLLPVSISMMTSFISGLTLVGSPAEMYHHGMNFSMVILGMILHVPFSSLILLPVFHRLESFSVFSYLELRYGKWIKRITSLAFMFQMTLYNAVVLFVPSLSLQSVLAISDKISIGLVGLSCLIYCTLGGIKAVIWTDFFQAGLMYLALICIVIGGTLEVGGLSRVIDINLAGDRLKLDKFLNFDLETRHTLFNICTGSLLINIFMNGANQIQVQRALSLPSLRQAQWSQLYASLFTMLISIISSYVGLVMYATYYNCDPFSNNQIDKRDALVIYYVSTNLLNIPGLRGIFVAGIFAATLSTLSSFQNSMSALVLEDFIKPTMKNRPLSESSITLIGKLLALLFGIICIGLTFLVGRISGLLQVAYTLFGSLSGPFISVFFLGMMTRFTNAYGAFIGIVIGTCFAIIVQLGQTFSLPPLEPTLNISTAGCPVNSTGNFIHYKVATTHKQEETLYLELIKMSYLWLPVASFLLTTIVSVIVSLSTGGWKQKVADVYLIALLHKEHKDQYDRRLSDSILSLEAVTNGKIKNVDE